ncbi:hypothetical protein [uncultured Paraglaciecola sp.]|uniref:hypothetical protein n=1 Tax=uncultured Paraglaciecola sp. TaxID=1765024 RepID=UPI00259953C2|nr:hypothetical protein [uncultured Paraglaciecola sp.]
MKQNYYRLAELDREFGLSLGKLRYLIENNELDLLFNRGIGKCLIGSVDSKGRFVGYGVANYTGIFSPQKNDQLTLIIKGKVECTKLRIAQNQHIQRLSDEYPYILPTPNSTIADWQQKDQIADNENIWAIPYLRETDGLMRGLFGLLTNRDDNIIETVNETINKLPDKTLIPKPLVLTFEDITVARATLIRLGLIDENSVKHVIERKSVRTENAFKRLVQNLIQLYPQKGGTALWNYLYEHHNSDESLDPESILCEIGRDELTWVDSKNIERSITKKRFKNIVAEEKNK